MFNYTFQWKQALARLPQMLDGALVTMQIAILSMVIGIGLAIVLTMFRLSGVRVLSAVSKTWVEVARNTPALFQIYMAHFGLGSFGIHLSPFASILLGIAFLPMTNQMVWAILMTSLGVTVGMNSDLYGVTQDLNALTFRTFELFALAAVIFYVITKVITLGARLIAARLFRY